MPDYIYLLENRLSSDQQKALRQIGEAARDAGMTVFLVGGAVRDLTSGSSVRDLDVTVQGNALKLKKPLIKMGATLWGEHEASRTMFFRFPVSVRVEVSSARYEEYPKPGKPVYHWSSIHEDLRRRDFTANAMALSLNDGSYGLLLDPLNGVADIELRQLRLVNNYGFLEEPARLLRATRLAARLGWALEERTKTRFQTAKDDDAIHALSSYQKGYELEEIGHEEDGLRSLAAMEAEGWMRHLDPAWTSAKANVRGLEEMHQLNTQLQMQGVNADISAPSMQLLTEKLHAKDLTALKRMLVRPGFVEEWDHLDTAAKEFARRLIGKESGAPSATWKLFMSANPQAALWLGLTSKAAPIQAKYKNFFTVWPEARQKVPHALMLELRITPELPGYADLLDRIFFASIDGKLETEEQLRAFLEPYSPPAPPPPVIVRRSRTSRKSEPKGKQRTEAGQRRIESASDAESQRMEEEKGDKGSSAQVTATQAPPSAKKGKAPAKVDSQGQSSGAGKREPSVAVKAAGKPKPKKQSKPVPPSPSAKANNSGSKPAAKSSQAARSSAKPMAAKASAAKSQPTAKKSHHASTAAASQKKDPASRKPASKSAKNLERNSKPVRKR